MNVDKACMVKKFIFFPVNREIMSHIKVGLQYSTLGFETALDRFCLPFKVYIFSTARPIQVKKKRKKN